MACKNFFWNEKVQWHERKRNCNFLQCLEVKTNINEYNNKIKIEKKREGCDFRAWSGSHKHVFGYSGIILM